MLLVTLIFPLLLFVLVVVLFSVEQRFILGEKEPEADDLLIRLQDRGPRLLQRTGPCVAVRLDVTRGWDGTVGVRRGECAHPRGEGAVPRIDLAPVTPSEQLGGDTVRDDPSDGPARPTAA